MDYFARQRQARWLAGLAFWLTTAALACLSLVATAIAAVGLHGLGYVEPGRSAWNSTLALVVASGVFAISVWCVYWRTRALRRGGHGEARRLGAEQLADDRIRTVLEELAVTTGLPVPTAFVLESDAVNAFVVGVEPIDAAIVITRGATAVEEDPLRVILARELIRAADGDMLLNTRIACFTSMLTFPAVLAHALRIRARRAGRILRGPLHLVSFGAGLAAAPGQCIALGVRALAFRLRGAATDTCGMVLAGVSDGAAVALQQSVESGESIDVARTLEYQHAMFTPPRGTWLARRPWLRAHVQIEERVRAIGLTHGRVRGELSYAEATMAQVARDTDNALEALDELEPEHVRRSRALLAAIPSSVRTALRDDVGAHAVITTLLTRVSKKRHEQQRKRFTSDGCPQAILRARDLHDEVRDLDPATWIAIADLAAPALREMDADRCRALEHDLLLLTNGDAETLEFITTHVWLHHLRRAHARKSLFRRQRRLRKADWRPLVALALMLVRIGNSDQRSARTAFGSALQIVGVPAGKRLYSDVNQRIVGIVGQAIDGFAKLAPIDRRRVLHMALVALAGDHDLQPIEVETVRGIGRALGCVLTPQADLRRREQDRTTEASHDRVLAELWTNELAAILEH